MWLLASVSCYVRSDIHCWRADKARGDPSVVTQTGGDQIKHNWVGREQGQNREVQKEQRINILKKKKKKGKYLLNTMMSSSTCAEVSFIQGCGIHLCQHLKLQLSMMVDKRNNSLLHRFSAVQPLKYEFRGNVFS